MSIDERLLALARRRQRETPLGYHNLAEFHDSAYECDFVSPYSKSAHGTESRVLVFLQDWISADALAGKFIPEAVQYGRIPSLPTNRNLDRLLEHGLGLTLGQTYVTNLFPFIKPGGMSAPLPGRLLRWAAAEYALPHIDILTPRLVVALGLATFRALAAATGRPSASCLEQAIAEPFDHGEARVWCQAHPGALGQKTRNRGRPGQTTQDWETMGQWYRASLR